jgi:hypothetical protein
MQIDWIFLTYLVVGFCALIGFFRGWWKEAITTFALALLVVLLQRPDWASTLIDFLNQIITLVWGWVVKLFGTLPWSPSQLDSASTGTWIGILFVLLGLSALIARLALPGTAGQAPGKYYTAGLVGRLLGLFMGALNGFLILSLVREYLDGRALPGNTAPQSAIAIAGNSTFGPASTTLTVQAVNLPSFTILDSYLPWLVIGLGVLIFAVALKTRIRVARSQMGSKIEYVPPYGYRPVEVPKSKPKKETISLADLVGGS